MENGKGVPQAYGGQLRDISERRRFGKAALVPILRDGHAVIPASKGGGIGVCPKNGRGVRGDGCQGGPVEEIRAAHHFTGPPRNGGESDSACRSAAGEGGHGLLRGIGIDAGKAVAVRWLTNGKNAMARNIIHMIVRSGGWMDGRMKGRGGGWAGVGGVAPRVRNEMERPMDGNKKTSAPRMGHWSHGCRSAGLRNGGQNLKLMPASTWWARSSSELKPVPMKR
ncbi:MAG: hypothetical protein JWL81_2135 [Verrucomicrobiales bacterium]|nr:hypothetical protein [Verrucomicrobiales bacterium]